MNHGESRRPNGDNHEGALQRSHEGHEHSYDARVDSHEEQDRAYPGRSRMRRPSPLSREDEDIIHAVIGAAIAVHRELGPGFLECIYQRCMHVELAARRLEFEAERRVDVEYRGVRIPGQRIDLIVQRRIVVELKAVTRFERIHVGQVISYLKTTGLRGGLLINFRVPLLMRGIKRIVL